MGSSLQNISGHLHRRLNDIASGPNKHVQLHSRLFSQWIHHVFPRECPYPHEEGTIALLTPDEWLKEVGEETEASDMELLEHVGRLTCTSIEDCEVNAELPWTGTDRLLAPHEHHFAVPLMMRTNDKTCAITFMSFVAVFFISSIHKLK